MLLTNFIAWQPKARLVQRYSHLARCLFYLIVLLNITTIFWLKKQSSLMIQESQLCRLQHEYHFWSNPLTYQPLNSTLTIDMRDDLPSLNIENFLNIWSQLSQIKIEHWRLNQLTFSPQKITLTGSTLSLHHLIEIVKGALSSLEFCVEYQLSQLSSSTLKVDFTLNLLPKWCE